jgi:hypothetical protein
MAEATAAENFASSRYDERGISRISKGCSINLGGITESSIFLINV